MTSGTARDVRSTAPAGAETRKRTARTQVVRRGIRLGEWQLIATAFGLHWLVVTLFAALGTTYARQQPVVQAVGWQLPELQGWQHLLVQPLRNWDGFWYALIAIEGYDYHPAATAFWPLYPWSMRVVSAVLPLRTETAGWLLANIAFVAALVVLYRLARLEWGEGVARRAVLLLALFPTAYYFSAVYSESFFLLFSLLAFYWARTGRWWQAGLAGVLAALTRNVGVLLVLPLAITFAREHGRNPRLWPRTAAALLLPGAGPLIYFAYLANAFGDPLLTLDAQQGWARTQAWPWETFQMAYDQLRLGWLQLLVESPAWATLTSHPVRFSFSEYESLDVAVTLLALPLLVLVFRRQPVEYGVYTAVVFALPLFSPSLIHPLMSFPRFAIVLFPLFVALAQLTRRRVVLAAALGVSTILLALLTVQFATWYWVA